MQQAICQFKAAGCMDEERSRKGTLQFPQLSAQPRWSIYKCQQKQKSSLIILIAEGEMPEINRQSIPIAKAQACERFSDGPIISTVIHAYDNNIKNNNNDDDGDNKNTLNHAIIICPIHTEPKLC